MDIARSLCKNNNVSIVYRRNMANAPASLTEIEDVRKENINIIELASPVKINTDINNNIKSITVLGIFYEKGFNNYFISIIFHSFFKY